MKNINICKELLMRAVTVNSPAPALAGSSGIAPSARFGGLALVLLVAACAAPPPPPHIGSFGDFTPPARQPHYLACPQNYCLAIPDIVTPLIPVPADRMRGILRHALETQPATALVSTDNEGLRLVYRQGTPSGTSLVTVDIVDAEDGASGLAIYSQSETGDRAADRDVVWRLIDTVTRAAAPSAG
jgi:hypothetical protein